MLALSHGKQALVFAFKVNHFEVVLHFLHSSRLLRCLELEALPTHRHVALDATNQLDGVVHSGAQSVGGLRITYFADRVELLYFFALGNEVKNIVEGFAEGGA